MDYAYNHPEGDMPAMFDKFKRRVDARGVASGGVEVRVQPGAGIYEDKFRNYWLITAWSFLAYQVLAMTALIFHIAGGGSTYLWLPHLVCTMIIVFGTGFMASIYRLILFPSPGYYTTSPQDVAGINQSFFGGQPQDMRGVHQPEGVAA